MPVRRHHEPVVVPRHTYGGASVRHDYGIDDSISRADYLSNAVLSDTYDAASRSRGRDQELMRSVNNAIVNTEQHISPKAAVVARRVRASTLPPSFRGAPANQTQSQVTAVRQVEEYQRPAARPYVVVVANNPSSYSSNPYPVPPKPVVYVEPEAPWYTRSRAQSVAPVDRRTRSASVPPGQKRAPPSRLPPEPLPTSNVWASRPMMLRSDVLRRARAGSAEPMRRASMYEDMSKARAAYHIPTSHVWASRPMPLRKDAVIMARAKANAMYPYGISNLKRTASEPRVDRASDIYARVPDVKERALNSYLYSHRGRFGADSKPPRPKMANFPQVYVPWHGTGPSNRSKAAIIGSRMDGDEGMKKRKGPRSQFAANKYREMKKDELERKYNY